MAAHGESLQAGEHVQEACVSSCALGPGILRVMLLCHSEVPEEALCLIRTPGRRKMWALLGTASCVSCGHHGRVPEEALCA
jgi:hypothetical protein